LAVAFEVLWAAGEHHRRCRHFRCGALVEWHPTLARSDHQLVLGSWQVVAMTGHYVHSALSLDSSTALLDRSTICHWTGEAYEAQLRRRLASRD
jgi:hypothetical protein